MYRSLWMWMALALLVSIQHWPGSAQADAPNPWKVVLLTARAPAELEVRIRAELSARGFELSIRQGSIRPSQLAAEENASMVIGLGPAAVDIWSRMQGAEPDSGMGHTHYKVEAGKEGIVAIQVAEFARAALLHASARGSNARSVPAVTASRAAPTQHVAASRPSQSSAGRFALATSAGVAFSRGQADPVAQVSLSAAWWVWSYVGFELTGFVPLGFRERGDNETFVAFSPYMISIGVRAGTHRIGARWNVDGGLGGGALLSHMYGATPSVLSTTLDDPGPVVKNSRLMGSPFAYLRAGVSLRIAGPLRLRADAFGGLGDVEIVEFSSDDPKYDVSGTWAEWGHVWVSTTLGLELLAL